MASTNDERRAVKHVDGVVLDRNGLPTFVVRGKEYIHVDHAGASYLYSQAALDEAIAAERERWVNLREWLERSAKEYDSADAMSIAESIHCASAMREVLALMKQIEA